MWQTLPPPHHYSSQFHIIPYSSPSLRNSNWPIGLVVLTRSIQFFHFLRLLLVFLLVSNIICWYLYPSPQSNILYQYESSSGIQWKTFGNEKVQPKYEGKITNMKPTRLSSIHDVGKSSFWLFYNLIFYLRHFRPFFLVQ